MTRLFEIGNALSGMAAVAFWFLSAKIFKAAPHLPRSLKTAIYTEVK